jgi:cellulose synthase (UDP-forming)
LPAAGRSPDNSHAKAGNINAALTRTEGELVLMLDADHVPMPDALDAMVGYFDDERMALVQSPHDFFNHDSVQHYVVGRHEQSLFYRVVCPGKDRHGAAYWCGSAALIRRQALLEIGGVTTETIAEDFHTTIRVQRHGWRSRYHDEVLVQGLAPHDLDGYLLQRDRWARGNLAVFTLSESPLRAKELQPLQRLSYFVSLFAYLAPPMRLLLMATLGLVMWTGELPMKISVMALAALWLPYVTLNLGAGSALARGSPLRDAQPRRRLRPRPRLHEDRRDRPLRAADDGDLHAGAALHLPPRPHRLQGDAEAG